jgi:methionyl aminopeptidase
MIQQPPSDHVELKEEEEEEEEVMNEGENGAGESEKKKKKKKKSKKKKGAVPAVQSDPPRVGLSLLFPNGIYPEGEVQEYKNE